MFNLVSFKNTLPAGFTYNLKVFNFPICDAHNVFSLPILFFFFLTKTRSIRQKTSKMRIVWRKEILKAERLQQNALVQLLAKTLPTNHASSYKFSVLKLQRGTDHRHQNAIKMLPPSPQIKKLGSRFIRPSTQFFKYD